MRRTAAAVALAILGTTGLALAAAEKLAPARIVRAPENPQRPGDAERGREYVLYGDYIGSGIPYEVFVQFMGPSPDAPLLDRRGPASIIPHGFNTFQTAEGARVVAGANCLACHAQVFRGELVIGLGNTLRDWPPVEPTATRTGARAMQGLIALRYGLDAPERTAYARFQRGIEALAGVGAPFRGVNPAFAIEDAAASHRVPEDLSWSDEPLFEPVAEPVSSDVPPWWHLRKKHALYYNGMGRGDFGKHLQQINVVGIEDEADAARTAQHMHDVVAFLQSIEPPAYPGDIDPELATRGEAVFVQHCARCHGTYGGPGIEDDVYPNKLVPIDVVGTDPAYAEMLAEAELPRWFNRSWFATSEPRAWAVAELRYIAPPLDGIWCTAPYLHNGSVPTLEALLDSSLRPALWFRSVGNETYDLDAVGWSVATLDASAGEPGTLGRAVYDTRLRGYGNGGHTFGDDLTPEERRAVIEYLKSL